MSQLSHTFGMQSTRRICNSAYLLIDKENISDLCVKYIEFVLQCKCDTAVKIFSNLNLFHFDGVAGQ